MTDAERAALVRAKNREQVLSQDLIVVGGGNTDMLLYMLRRHGLDAILHEAYEKGIVLFGLSAGGIYPTRGGSTDSFHSVALQPLDSGLGWLHFLFSPRHQAGMRRPLLKRIMEGSNLGCNVYTFSHAYAADDGVSLVFENEQLVDVVSDRPGALGYELKLELTNGSLVARKTAVETKLPTRLLP